MKHVMRQLRVLMAGIVLVGIPVSAAAQDAPRVEISAGWPLLISFEELSSQFNGVFPLGWYGDVAVTLSDGISVVGDVAGSYRHIDESSPTTQSDIDIRLYTFMGGVRFSNRSHARIVPFGQVLIGVIAGSIEGTSTFSNATRSFVVVLDRSEQAARRFTVDLGGGVTFKLRNAVGLRINGSYLKPTEQPFKPANFADGASGVRFGVGIVLPF
jgi:hypothetical protein